MAPLKYITHSACKLSWGIALLVGAPTVCALMLLSFGLVLYPQSGSASFDPALSFIGDVSPTLWMASVLLVIGVVALLQVAGFGYTNSALPSNSMLVRLIRILASWLPFLQVSNPLTFPGSHSLQSAFSSSQTLAPGAASASGASPQLE